MSIIPIVIVVLGLLGATSRPGNRRPAEPFIPEDPEAKPEILRRPLTSRFPSS
jgi:hypothetical protein